MASIQSVFVAGAAIHGAAALVFALLGACSRRPFSARTDVARAAFAVSLVTAGVYVAQASGAGTFERVGDATTQYVAEWLGYTLSLALIGWSLAASLGASAARAATASYWLALVGAGGTLGLFVAEPLAQGVLVALTSVAYLEFFVIVYPSSSSGRVAVVAFGVATLAFYVAPYIAGPPVINALSATTEHVLYLVGNTLTKIALPLFEMYVLLAPS